MDFAFETDLRVKSLLELIKTIAKDIGGKEGQDLFASFDEKLPDTSLSLNQLFGHLDTRVVGLLRVDWQRAFVAPEDKVTVPGFDALLAVDDLAILFDAYHGLLEALPNVKTSSEGDLRYLEFDIAAPGAAWLKPVLVKNTKSGRLFAASSKGFVKEYLAEKTRDKALARAADFRRATANFLPQANALTYMSGAFTPKVVRFVKPLGKDDKDVQAGLDIVLELLPEDGIPFAAQQVNLPDGLYYSSYARASHKAALLPALVVGPTILAGAVAGAISRDHPHASEEPQKGPTDTPENLH